jgi:membrane-bound ClpP family serine protease
MKDRNSNPFTGIAKLLISLGLVMIAAKTDLLGLGTVSEYFTWEMLLIFFGIFSFISLDLVSSVILFAIGFYFLMPDMKVQLSPVYKNIYWPAVIVLTGIAFLLKPLTNKLK